MKLFKSKSVFPLLGCKGRAATIGHYSLGPKNYTATWEDHLFVHEYGHYIQSQEWGPLFIPVIGIPSLVSAGLVSKNGGPEHDDRWFERQASRKGGKHFMRKYGPDSGRNLEYYFDYEAYKKGGGTSYINPRTGYKNRSPYKINKANTYIWDFIP